MSSYRNLKAWQHALRLAVECSQAAKKFPTYERYVLAVQLRRAGYSVVLNIAEGGAVPANADASSIPLEAPSQRSRLFSN